MKTLILYETTHGSTEVCARKLAAALGGKTEIFALKDFFGDPLQYDCVIVGSPVYGGSILKEIKSYCKANLAALTQKPFAVFFACLSDSDSMVRTYLAKNFPPELAEHALACVSLGGAFYFTKLNFLERSIDKSLAKAYAKSMGIAAPDGKTDFITISDEKIAEFAEKIKKAAGKTEGS